MSTLSDDARAIYQYYEALNDFFSRFVDEKAEAYADLRKKELIRRLAYVDKCRSMLFSQSSAAMATALASTINYETEIIKILSTPGQGEELAEAIDKSRQTDLTQMLADTQEAIYRRFANENRERVVSDVTQAAYKYGKQLKVRRRLPYHSVDGTEAMKNHNFRWIPGMIAHSNILGTNFRVCVDPDPDQEFRDLALVLVYSDQKFLSDEPLVWKIRQHQLLYMGFYPVFLDEESVDAFMTSVERAISTDTQLIFSVKTDPVDGSAIATILDRKSQKVYKTQNLTKEHYEALSNTRFPPWIGRQPDNDLEALEISLLPQMLVDILTEIKPENVGDGW
jgi:hypothetical protein